MAVPNEMTTLDTSGCYYMNPELSDDISEVLQLVPLSPSLAQPLPFPSLPLLPLPC